MDLQQKLKEVDAAWDRWFPRAVRAVNKIAELNRKRARLRAMLGKPTAKPAANAAAKPKVTATMTAALAVPPFLDRADPHIAETLTKARKAAEAEARKAMPLAGRQAEAFLKNSKKASKTK